MLKSARIASVLALGALFTPSLAALPSQAAPAPIAVKTAKVKKAKSKLVLTPAQPMAGETVVMKGKAAKKARVKLQTKVKKRWRTVAKAKANKRGAYTFSVKAGAVGAKTRYQVRAGKKIVGKARVASVAQSIAFTLPDKAVVGDVLYPFAVATPARQDRPFMLQALLNNVWTPVGTAKYSPEGRVTFTVSAATAGTYTYRVMGEAFNGAGVQYSNTASITIVDKPVNPPPPPPPPNGEQPPIGVDEEAAKAIQSYDSSTETMTFSSNVLESIKSAKPGTLMGVGITPKTPKGALIKIETVIVNIDGSVTVDGTSGALAELMYLTPEAPDQIELVPVKTEITDQPGGVRFEPVVSKTEVAKRGLVGPAALLNDGELEDIFFRLTVDINNDFDNREELEWSIAGELMLKPKVDAYIKDPSFSLSEGIHADDFKLGGGVNVDGDLTARLHADADTSDPDSIKLGGFKHYWTGMIGYVPVVIANAGDAVFDFDISAAAYIGTTVELEGDMVGGIENLKYNIVDGKEFPNDDLVLYARHPEGDMRSRLGGIAELELFLGFAFSSAVYNAGGPVVKVGQRTKGEIDIHSPTDFAWPMDWKSLDLHNFLSCEIETAPEVIVEITWSDKIKEHIGAFTDASIPLLGFQLAEPKKFECPRPNEDPVIFTEDSLPDARQGSRYEAKFTTVDSNVVTWRIVDGQPPPGMFAGNADDQVGQVSGAPTTPGNYVFTLQAEDVYGRTDTREYHLEVKYVQDVSIPADLFPIAMAKKAYKVELEVEGEPDALAPSVDWELMGGELPPGLELKRDPMLPQSVEGVPTTPGVYYFTLKATATNPMFGADTHRFKIVVQPNELDEALGKPMHNVVENCGVQNGTNDIICWEGTEGAWGELPNYTVTRVPGEWKSIHRGIYSMKCGVDLANEATCWGSTAASTGTDFKLPGKWKSVAPRYRELVCGITMDNAFACVRKVTGGGVSQLVMQQHTDFTDWKRVATGSDVCALRTNGEVWCLDTNPDGEDPFKRVNLPFSAIDLTVRSSITCALSSDYVKWCWGVGSQGSRGIDPEPGFGYKYPVPTRISTWEISELGQGTGFSSGCDLSPAGKPICWLPVVWDPEEGEDSAYTDLATEIATDQTFTKVLGGYSQYGVTADGSVWTWGRGYRVGYKRIKTPLPLLDAMPADTSYSVEHHGDF